MLDIGPIASYVFAKGTTKFYLLTLTAKLFIVIANRLPAAARLQHVWPFLCFTMMVALFDLTFLASPLPDVVQLIGFTLQAALTLILVRPDQLRSYLGTIGAILLANFALYLLFLHDGLIGQHYDRYYYFGDYHPNLGAEIAATGIACAAAALDGWVFLIALALETAAINFMQGRSALLVAAGVAVVLALKQTAKLTRRYQRGGIAIIFAALAALTLFWEPLQLAVAGLVSQALLLNDPNRGTSSGFTGRTQGWHDATMAFLQSPICGMGVGYFDNPAIWPPHNLLLFLAAQFGVFGLPVMCLIFYKYYRLFLVDRMLFYIWLQFLPLLFFNDRIFNLNPYPFVFYIVLLAV